MTLKNFEIGLNIFENVNLEKNCQDCSFSIKLHQALLTDVAYGCHQMRLYIITHKWFQNSILAKQTLFCAKSPICVYDLFFMFDF